MSNIRLFFSESLYINLKSKLDKTQSHYIHKVMRIKEGQNFSLFNQSGEFEAKVENIIKGIVEFSVEKKLRSADNPTEIWLAFTPIKLNYLNLMIQKATELGVTRFAADVGEPKKKVPSFFIRRSPVPFAIQLYVPSW